VARGWADNFKAADVLKRAVPVYVGLVGADVKDVIGEDGKQLVVDLRHNGEGLASRVVVELRARKSRE
jgi:hypothetical protein